jgi:hypothetical protein
VSFQQTGHAQRFSDLCAGDCSSSTQSCPLAAPAFSTKSPDLGSPSAPVATNRPIDFVSYSNWEIEEARERVSDSPDPPARTHEQSCIREAAAQSQKSPRPCGPSAERGGQPENPGQSPRPKKRPSLSPHAVPLPHACRLGPALAPPRRSSTLRSWALCCMTPWTSSTATSPPSPACPSPAPSSARCAHSGSPLAESTPAAGWVLVLRTGHSATPACAHQLIQATPGLLLPACALSHIVLNLMLTSPKDLACNHPSSRRPTAPPPCPRPVWLLPPLQELLRPPRAARHRRRRGLRRHHPRDRGVALHVAPRAGGRVGLALHPLLAAVSGRARSLARA